MTVHQWPPGQERAVIAGRPDVRIIRTGRPPLRVVRTEVRRDEGRGVRVAVTVPVLEIVLLGPFQVTLAGEPVTGFGSDTARALLAYLAMTPAATHRRDALAGLLWPDVANADALRNLRVTLSRLRDAIGDRDATPPFLDVTRKTIRWAGAPSSTVDVWTVREAIATAQVHDHEHLDACEACARQLQAAVRLYRGDLLAGFALDSAPFEEWLVAERESVHWAVLEALHALAQWHQRRGDLDAVIACARRQVELEPWRETAHRQCMTALAIGGRRGAALAQYESCRQALLDELGVAPEAATVKLRDDIQGGLVAPQGAPPLKELGRDSVPVISPVVSPLRGADTGPLPQQASQEGEWRSVTVVKARVMGADSLRSAVGLEGWAWCLTELLRAAGTEARSFGGVLDRYDEAGLLSLFGAVEAHEDDAERAVLAAVAMPAAFEKRLSELAQRTPEWQSGLADLDIAVAVDAGSAIVTQIGGRSGNLSVIGDVTGAVARLLDHALAGQVLVSPPVHQMVAPLFRWASTEGDRAANTYRPLAHLARRDKGRGISGMRSDLVGRAGAVRSLTERTELLQGGEGGIVTLVGDAGIGKSRLVAEWRAATAGAARWVEGRCLSYSCTAAYGLWTSALRALIGVTPEAPAAAVKRALRRTLRELAPDEPEASWIYLCHLLAVSQDAAVEATLAEMEGQGLQNGIVHALRRLLRATAARQPLVVVCEDLHWADPTSLALFTRLFSMIEEAPILFVCVMRRQPDHGCWEISDTAQQTYAHRYTNIGLEPLTASEGEALLANLLLSIPGPEGRETVDALPAELKAEILDRGEGNPFFIEEVLRSLIRSGVIDCDEVSCTWELDEGREVRIPETLYGVLQSRIDQLPVGARQVLQLASVIGRAFSYPLLSAVAARGDLDGHLALLQDEQLVRARQGGSELAFIFKHQLTFEVTYGGLLQRVRRPLHRRVAEALERLHPGRIEANLSLLAHHWEQAGMNRKAVEYLRRSGDRAANQYAANEAAAHYSRALGLVPQTDRERRYALLLARSTAFLRRTTVGPRVVADLPVLLRLAEELGDPGRRAEMLLLKAEHAFGTGDQADGDAAARAAIALARESRDRRTEALATYALGRARSFERDQDQAEANALLQSAAALARADSMSAIEAQILRRYALILQFQSEFDAATEAAGRALELWRGLGNTVEEGRVINVLGQIARDRGDYPEARRLAEAGLALCRETGNRYDEAYALQSLSLVMMSLAEYTIARAHAEQALTVFAETDANDEWARVALSCAECHLGNHASALAVLSQAPGIASVQDPFVTAWVQTTTGLVAHRNGDHAMAVACGRRTVASTVLGSRRRFHLPVTGAALTAMGRLQEARDVYGEATGIWEHVGLSRMSAEPLAGLAQVALLQGDMPEALGIVERLLGFLQMSDALGAALEPLRVHLVCARVLAAAGDPRADSVLREGHRKLMVRAEKIGDAELRASYLAIPVHREILEDIANHRW